MVIPEEIEVAASGWPLGLGNMNIWLRVGESSNNNAQHPFSLNVPSPSFSSISSSNLDTESTASFFPDRSVSLGRLIGIRPGKRVSALQFPARTVRRVEENRSNNNGHRRTHSDGQGVCVPLLHNVMGKMNRTKSTTKITLFHHN